tara:strand:+ start:525 stop:875 length:351 start_codon:yes stop_codon:yes gene_type:complete
MASIAAVKLNDRIKNDTFSSVQFEYNEGGLPLDITGSTIKIQFRHKSNRGDILYTAETGSGITITNATSGVFRLDEFTPTDWKVGVAHFDVQMTFADGSIRTWIKGTVNILQDTTL